MADKREQCEKCTMNCPPNIIQSKINKGRIPFGKCMDFSPIQTNADKIRSMSDEELAELFTKLAWNSEVQTTPLKYLEWLQSEAE